MQELRDTLVVACQKLNSLYEKNENDLKDFKTYMVGSLGVLKVKVSANESSLSLQKQGIEDLHKMIMYFHDIHSKNTDMDRVKNEIVEQMQEATKNHLCSIQDLQREFKAALAILQDDLDKFKQNADRRLSEQSNRIEARFNVNKMDREAVLKEIRVYEKTVFVIEKKLENIYTLIERIKEKIS
jgi:uncharacterized protein YPO0396